ncbi:hypothetical protein ACWEKT_40840 [Nocardia takedensis]
MVVLPQSDHRVEKGFGQTNRHDQTDLATQRQLVDQGRGQRIEEMGVIDYKNQRRGCRQLSVRGGKHRGRLHRALHLD